MNMINYGNLSYHSEDNPLKVWWTCLEIIRQSPQSLVDLS